MTIARSAIYRGVVMHRRLRPRAHKLRYSIFNILFDLDELAALDSRLILFSRNRFNFFSFYDRDHGDGERPLREHVEGVLEAHGLGIHGGPIRLLCLPRILGFVFNPLSIYFCFRRSGELTAILYEVNNTFGERHWYVAGVTGTGGTTVAQASAKRFHVSPFLPLDLQYRFRIAAPAETVGVSVHVHDRAGLLVAASLSAHRMELTNGALSKTLVAYPLLTLKVVAGIHWEALKLWLKGTKVHAKPLPPARQVTFGQDECDGAKGDVVSAGAADRTA